MVGGGISGLSAAHFYRQKLGPGANILVLDNHDDFGGHAKRNEFNVDGRKLLCYGGSQSIDTPGSYSRVAKQLLLDVGIHTERFHDYFDGKFASRHNLTGGMYFSQAAYGSDLTLPDFRRAADKDSADSLQQLLTRYPLPAASREALLQLVTSDRDYLAGKNRDDKISYLRSISYRDYLLDTVGVPQDVYLLMRDWMRGLWGVGYDALSALEGYRYEAPGTAHLGIGVLENDGVVHDEPYIFHFPDGNAGVARSLVRQLLPTAVPGDSMEDLVLARVNYSMLDAPGNSTRIRLNSTAVDVRHSSDDKHVDVVYVSAGQTYRVRAKHTVMACYNNILPYICSELPEDQVTALNYATKVPLVYISMAVRNWQPFAELGYNSITVPQPELMHSFGLDFPVSMGGYEFTDDPSQPTVLHGTYVPTVPDQGLSAREQHQQGRRQLYQISFDEFERRVVAQLEGALGKAGFDAERDLAALTVNRWPHGYAYEYNELFDPVDYGPGVGPHLLGARQLGRISIANSDASAFAYVNGAIDAAHRAVLEQTRG